MRCKFPNRRHSPLSLAVIVSLRPPNELDAGFIKASESVSSWCGISRRFQGGDFGQSRFERARSLFGAEVDTFCANERDVAHTKEAEESGEIAFGAD